MNVLDFEHGTQTVGKRRVRRARFEKRSSLPVSAACVVANGVRETLGPLLPGSVSIQLLEPIIPDANAWDAICSGAHVFGVRGPAADAAFVLRPRDALAFAAAAFGENSPDARALSQIEHEVLMRVMRAVAGCLTPVCGRELSPIERILDIRGYATYFELLLEGSTSLRLGVALSRDPAPRGPRTLRLEDLSDVELELAVEFARVTVSAAAFLDLGPDSIVPMKTRMGEPALLTIAGAVLARGECGTLDERNAMIVRGI